MSVKKVSDSILYVGVDDRDIDLFESQYVVPEGVSYNSYVIIDEKIAVLDTVDKSKTSEWLCNVEEALAGRTPDYVIVSHMEGDHSASLVALLEKYPNITVVGNVKTFPMIKNFFGFEDDSHSLVVKEGDVLELGSHRLKFIMAPMIHWPEVMMNLKKSCFQQMLSENSVRLILRKVRQKQKKKTGHARHGGIILTLSENTVPLFRHF